MPHLNPAAFQWQLELEKRAFILNYWVLACTLSLSGNKYQIRENNMTNVTYEV